jgi:hypothetical protein
LLGKRFQNRAFTVGPSSSLRPLVKRGRHRLATEPP